MLTEIRAISDEQPPSVSYARGYMELSTILHTFRTDNEASRVASICRQEDRCLLLSPPFLYSQKDSNDSKQIEVIETTHPVQKYEVRIHFYIHFIIPGSPVRCPSISGNAIPFPLFSPENARTPKYSYLQALLKKTCYIYAGRVKLFEHGPI